MNNINQSDMFANILQTYLTRKGKIMRRKDVTFKKIVAVCLAFCLGAGTLTGCGKNEQAVSSDTIDMSKVNNTTSMYAGTDDLGRTLELYKDGDDSKEVGVFYFLWLGAHGDRKLYDVSKILEKDPNAADDSVSWLKAGGGPAGAVHWWGESLFGYFLSQEEWVIEKDVQMLTDAGVDFLALDLSNSYTYSDSLLVLLKVLDKYYQQGYEVPQITPITKAYGGSTIMTLYKDIYLKYPEYGHLWYQKDGKPLVIGAEMDEGLTDEAMEYFSFLYPQWPKEDYHANGFAWMDFGLWTDDGSLAVFGEEGEKTIMCISVAQHCGTLAWSSTAFYGDTTNHSRNWHDGANDPAEDAYLYGYNFGEQFEYAIEQNPDIIFITGWNEWVAARQAAWQDLTDPIIIVDTANIVGSRDIQPMKGGYGDNYYMQMVNYIRKFKGAPTTNIALNTAAEVKPVTIDIEKETSQWNAVSSYYLDYIEDTMDRSAMGFGEIYYKDETGRNDIYKMKIANDSKNLYAYVQTMDVIKGMDDDHCLSMFISTGNEENETWCGYDYVINRTGASADELVVEQRTASGWKKVGTATYSMKDNELQFAVPLSVLKLDSEDVSIQFKFADNYQGEDDIFSFYLNGDAAPYGRLNYVYESKGISKIEGFEINTKKAIPTWANK